MITEKIYIASVDFCLIINLWVLIYLNIPVLFDHFHVHDDNNNNNMQ